MPYLGHLAGPKGVRPNPEKSKEVQDIPVPHKKKDLRSFLGLAQYYRRLLLGFSHIASPLYDLLKLHASFDWQDCHQEALEALRAALVSSPISLILMSTSHSRFSQMPPMLGSALYWHRNKMVLKRWFSTLAANWIMPKRNTLQPKRNA